MRAIIFGVALFTLCNAYGGNYFGRILVGGFLSDERYNSFGEEQHNDYLFLTSRLYFNLYDLGVNKDSDFAIDLKDRYNFFGTLDRNDRQFKEDNRFHLKKLFYRREREKDRLIVGRFNSPYISSSYVDGVTYSREFRQNLSLGGWVGLLPTIDRESRPLFDKNHHSEGIFFGVKNTVVDSKNGVFSQSYKRDLDQVTLFHRQYLHFNQNHTVHSLFNLETRPKVNIQSLNISYRAVHSKKVTGRYIFGKYDNYQYKRSQDVRERLPVSPYTYVRTKQLYGHSSRLRYFLEAGHGKRSVDRLTNSNLKLGAIVQGFVDLSYWASIEKNYTNNSTEVGHSVSYGGESVESSLSQTISREIYPSGEKLYPIVSELSFASFMGRNFFQTLSLQHAYDKNTTILTALFYFTYNFGNRPFSRVRGRI
ncbi:MAG: hypothetical protein KAG61_12070 [Bacteriovoracaceae bacterium]|nr:hypothetical protein [Bacteriovoracaceae bacterium]